MPIDYNAAIPDGCDLIELSAHAMMFFQGAPYEDEDWFGGAHAEISHAIENYKPELYGYEFDRGSVPSFGYGTSAATGCREVIPVRPIYSK